MADKAEKTVENPWISHGHQSWQRYPANHPETKASYDPRLNDDWSFFLSKLLGNAVPRQLGPFLVHGERFCAP